MCEVQWSEAQWNEVHLYFAQGENLGTESGENLPCESNIYKSSLRPFPSWIALNLASKQESKFPASKGTFGNKMYKFQ